MRLINEIKDFLLNFKVRLRLYGDGRLWIIFAMLAFASLLVVYSSTASMAYRLQDGDTSHYLFRHGVMLIASFMVLVVGHQIPSKIYLHFSGIGFWVAIFLMGLTFVFGETMNSATRWLPIPGTGITFQPSDIVRSMLVLYLARQLTINKRQRTINKIRLFPTLSMLVGRRKNLPQAQRIILKNSIPLLGPIAIACLLILPSNFSTAAIVFFTSMLILYMGRVRFKELLRVVGWSLALFAILFMVMKATGIGRADTWQNRISSFIGVGDGEEGSDSYQKEHARIAVASGGLLGKGAGQSTQRANLPHSYSDFAYAFIVEEYGILGGVFCLFLYVWILYMAIRIFIKNNGTASGLLALGLALMILLQAMVNMSVSVGLGPVTGQTLPIISLGGSSLLITALSLAMLMSVSREAKEYQKELKEEYEAV